MRRVLGPEVDSRVVEAVAGGLVDVADVCVGVGGPSS